MLTKCNKQKGPLIDVKLVMRYEEVAERENEGSREFRCNKLYLCWNVKIVNANILAGGE
jgi:hypothetical protein